MKPLWIQEYKECIYSTQGDRFSKTLYLFNFIHVISFVSVDDFIAEGCVLENSSLRHAQSASTSSGPRPVSGWWK